jgi:D-psicose/D-tagatose/L-ribulose 3-epimerase
MRLAVSNIAWNPDEDEEISGLLRRYDVDAIDIAPAKYFPDPANTSEPDALSVRRWWQDKGIEITGMQALLFGTEGLNVFGPAATQDAMLAHLGAVCRIGGFLGATRLVLGSPRNRDRTGLSDDETETRATAFFRRLGDIAAAEGVIVCLEPNPPRYGANFMIDSAETARTVTTVDHPAIRMQLDSGAMTINAEDPAAVLSEYANLIGHIHASEPDLVPLGDGGTDHADVFKALSATLPGHIVCIEMVATENEPHMNSIERALQVACRDYRPTAGNTNQEKTV